MYVLIQSISNGPWEPSTKSVVDVSLNEEELKQKATLYNERSNKINKCQDDAREWYNNHQNDEDIPEIPEQFQPFIEIGEHEDMDGNSYCSLNWNYGRLFYYVEKVSKAYYVDK